MKTMIESPESHEHKKRESREDTNNPATRNRVQKLET